MADTDTPDLAAELRRMKVTDLRYMLQLGGWAEGPLSPAAMGMMRKDAIAALALERIDHDALLAAWHRHRERTAWRPWAR